jgi:hypothetical protein
MGGSSGVDAQRMLREQLLHDGGRQEDMQIHILWVQAKQIRKTESKSMVCESFERLFLSRQEVADQNINLI